LNKPGIKYLNEGYILFLTRTYIYIYIYVCMCNSLMVSLQHFADTDNFGHLCSHYGDDIQDAENIAPLS
jgi:hypothetical protein